MLIEKRLYASLYGKILLLALALAGNFAAKAQVKFYASSEKQVPVNQAFQLNFTCENGNLTQLKPPAVNDFQVLGGPNVSSSTQFMNGDMSQSITYTYILKPKREGVFKIGKAVASISGATLESNELTITVTGPVQAQPRAQQRRQWSPFDDIFAQDDPFEQQQPEEPANTGDMQKTLHDNVFIRLSADRTNVYMGEKVTASLKLYFKLNVGQAGVTKAPSFNGFWSQEIELPKDKQPQIENWNGQQFYVVELQKFNLYPQKSGNLQVSPAEANLVVQVPVQNRRRSFFDDFFARAQNMQYKPVSNALNITVKELPQAGKPENFSGAVGRFDYQVKLSSKEGKTDEPLTYSVKISGSGNLKTVEVPKPELPEAFEVYEPKTNEQLSNTAEGMSGMREYDYLLIPHQPGDYKIPGSAFSYFDPAAGKYITINAPEYSVKITGEPSANPNNNLPVAASKSDVTALGSDIRYIKNKAGEWKPSGASFFGTPTHLALMVSPFLLFTGLLFVRKRNEDLAADVIGAKKRRATRLAKKRLATAAKLLKAQNKTGYYDEVSRAIWGYLGDKLSIDPAQLSQDNVAEKLQEKKVNPQTISQLQHLIGICQQALYAPVGAGAEMQLNYESAISLIANLEEEIK